MRDFTRDDSAWADFLISKAALILASVILFSALFHLAAGFRELETQEQLDFLAMDFKTAVDKVGSGNLESDNSESSNQGSDNPSSGNSDSGNSDSGNLQSDNFYCFEENEIFRDLPFAGDIKLKVSGEYVCLEARCGERNFRAVRPFTFRILPFNESVLREKLSAEFGARGSGRTPLTADYSQIEAFLQASGTEEAILNTSENISLKKELIYVKDGKEVSAFGCVLVYQ